MDVKLGRHTTDYFHMYNGHNHTSQLYKIVVFPLSQKFLVGILVYVNIHSLQKSVLKISTL